MEEKSCFLMPDYFNSFSCKMGKCRRACCEGWPITFSVEDYFKLMSCECSEDLRRKLDTGIKVSLSPTPDMYASVVPRYDGSCPMRLNDGRCAIHAELGENKLSDVCRLYPRGLRIEPSKECSCSNSCEGVLELLFSKDNPIKFISDDCHNQLPPMGKRTVVYPTMGYEQEIRLHLISIIQNRNMIFPHRLSTLGQSMKSLEKIMEHQDSQGLKTWIETQHEYTGHYFTVENENLCLGLNIIKDVLKIIDQKSDSVRSYGEKALSFFDDSRDILSKYNYAKTRFEILFPKWETYFEHMIVNHMFFEQFPFQDRPVSLWNEYISLCAVYVLMRFISIGTIHNLENLTELVDIYSAIFRLVDHTSFDSYAATLLKSLNVATPEKLFILISL